MLHCPTVPLSRYCIVQLLHTSDRSDQIDHDLYDLYPNLTLRGVRRICIVQILPRKEVLDHAEYTAPARQHELDHTDHTDHTDEEYICPEISGSGSRNVCNLVPLSHCCPMVGLLHWGPISPIASVLRSWRFCAQVARRPSADAALPALPLPRSRRDHGRGGGSGGGGGGGCRCGHGREETIAAAVGGRRGGACTDGSRVSESDGSSSDRHHPFTGAGKLRWLGYGWP